MRFVHAGGRLWALKELPQWAADREHLLGVRWLLSEQAGHDVGDGPALKALVSGSAPSGSAAQMAVAEPARLGAAADED